VVGFGHGSSFRLNQCGAVPGPHQHLCGGEPKVGLPVVSRPGFSQRVHPLGRQEPRVLVCAHDDVPATVVHNAVVRAAQERQVRQICCAAVDPVDDMVRLGPGGGTSAAGEATSVVTDHKCLPLLRRHQPLLAPQVERRTVVIDDDRRQLAVTGDPAGTGRGDGSEPGHPAGRHRVRSEQRLVGTTVGIPR